MSNASLIDDNRHINVMHRWWDFIYDDFVEQMGKAGVHVDPEHIWFTGFCSQGDGASFTGYSTDAAKLCAAAEVDMALYTVLPNYLNRVTVKIERMNSRYCHSNTMHVWADVDTPLFDYMTYGLDDFRSRVADKLYAALLKELDVVEKKLETYLRAQADKLYRRLETEYDHLTSDEAVAEALEITLED